MAIIKKEDTEKETQEANLIPKNQVPMDVVRYLKSINQEHVLEEGITEHQLKKLKNVMQLYSLGAGATVIQTCSVKCTSYSRCPLAIINKAPIGSPCPIEIQLYSQLLEGYKKAVAQKIATIESITDIENDPIVLSLITQAVEIDIFQLRTNAQIAEAGLVEAVPVLASENGVEYALQETAASKIKRELNNRKDKVLRQLLATPEMVQKVKNQGNQNTMPDQKREILMKAVTMLRSKEEEEREKDPASGI